MSPNSCSRCALPLLQSARLPLWSAFRSRRPGGREGSREGERIERGGSAPLDREKSPPGSAVSVMVSFLPSWWFPFRFLILCYARTAGSFGMALPLEGDGWVYSMVSLYSTTSFAWGAWTVRASRGARWFLTGFPSLPAVLAKTCGSTRLR